LIPRNLSGTKPEQKRGDAVRANMPELDHFSSAHRQPELLTLRRRQFAQDSVDLAGFHQIIGSSRSTDLACDKLGLIIAGKPGTQILRKIGGGANYPRQAP
jgi:hypothetical protein